MADETKPTPEMLSQLANIPASAEPASQPAPQDQREKTINALSGIDGHLMQDDYGKHLKPEEVAQLRVAVQKDPKTPIVHQMDEVVRGRIARSVVPAMDPGQWEQLRQFAGEQAVGRADPKTIAAEADKEAMRQIGIKGFDNTVGKHKNYLVQQPEPTSHVVQTSKASAGEAEMPPLVAPKAIQRPAKSTPSSTFAQSLIDMVRGASEVGAKQQRTGKTINDELFEKILHGKGKY